MTKLGHFFTFFTDFICAHLADSFPFGSAQGFGSPLRPKRPPLVAWDAASLSRFFLLYSSRHKYTIAWLWA
jgi:hypothetical protein